MLENCKNLNLLYVEDNELERTITMLRFSKYFNEVIFVDNAIEALEVFEKSNIDLIITDIEMPKMNGLEFAKKIREMNYFLPIIVVTSNAKEDYLLEIANTSIQGFLKKPISNEEFFSTIQRVVTQTYNQIVKKIKLDENIYYYPHENSIEKDGTSIKLTKKEKVLLDLLLKNKNRLLSYANIEFFIWEDNEEIMTDNSLKTLIKNLRNKTSKDIIKNVSGLGYKLIIK